LLEFIEIRDATSFEFKGKKEHIVIWPATQFLQDISDLDNILIQMDQEKNHRVEEFEKA
jgi:excinuclease UvrABC helicase subunit UvrB